MDIRSKIINALVGHFPVHFARLEDGDGVTGFVVSPRFEAMSTLDRQALIEKALSQGPASLTSQERRRVLMIAGLTPVEYDAVGARIRVYKVRNLAGGTIEIQVDGGFSDAEYVRGALSRQKGISTTEPRQITGGLGSLTSFRATGTASHPMTKAKAIRILNGDHYIQVTPNA
jgi:hypothetical protein